MLSHFLDQWRSITSNRSVLNMVQGHHFQLRSHPSLFSNLKQFSIKAETHYPVNQKEVDELLAKGVTESSSDHAGFYSSVLFLSVLVVSGPYFNLKQFNCYLHIPPFKVATIRLVWQLILCGDYAFSNDLKDAYLHILILSIIIIFYDKAKYAMSVESYTFGSGHSPYGFYSTH